MLSEAIANPGADFIEMMVPSQDKVVPFVPAWVRTAQERKLPYSPDPQAGWTCHPPFHRPFDRHRQNRGNELKKFANLSKALIVAAA